MNGVSTFEPTDNPTMAIFSGQLKKKSQQAKPFAIPLLCKFEVFEDALAALRAKQVAGKTPVDSNAKCCLRYQKNLQRGLDAMIEKGALPLPPCHLHALRGIYAAMCFATYQCSHTLCYTCCRILGHSSLKESLAYSAYTVEGCEAIRGTFGPLRLAREDA
jgi:hypothetical protein